MNETAVTSAPHSSYRVPALEKGLDVLEFLADSSGGLSLTEIAEQLDRTKQELFRVVNCLHERGYLVRDLAQRYRMSTKLFELGSKHASTQTLVARAMPHMERLAEKIGESCHLNIVIGNRMLVVAQANSQADIALSVRIGASFDLHRRNTGRVALAYFSEARREEYWRKTGEAKSTTARWNGELAAIRERGFEEADSPVVLGVRDCATAIVGAGGRLLGVLCVSHVIRVGESSDHSEIARALVACATAISREFGPDHLNDDDD